MTTFTYISSVHQSATQESVPVLGLVVNVLVLWNTCYMNAALRHLRHQGYELKSSNVARLSPLGYKHINMLGRYQFSLAEHLKQGELRPLRYLNDHAHGAPNNLFIALERVERASTQVQ